MSTLRVNAGTGNQRFDGSSWIERSFSSIAKHVQDLAISRLYRGMLFYLSCHLT
jgi:hypothetical protein